MNYLICSIGKHAKLIKYMRDSIGENSKIVVTSNQEMLPALYFADKKYIMPDVQDENYIGELIKICKKENINAITTMLDIETVILAENKEKFEKIGVEVLTPGKETAKICYDKYLMFQYLHMEEIKTIRSYVNLIDFKKDYTNRKIKFPVFVKPRTGRGSVGAERIDNVDELESILNVEDNMMVQEYIDAPEVYVDVYVDIISGKPISIFAKKKIGTNIELGGTSKSISIIDKKLFRYVDNLISKFEFSGPINIDLFYKNGEYILTEINPRFSASYLHAYGCGVDFFKLMENNLMGIENPKSWENYRENMIMMKFDDVLIIDKSELANQ